VRGRARRRRAAAAVVVAARVVVRQVERGARLLDGGRDAALEHGDDDARVPRRADADPAAVEAAGVGAEARDQNVRSLVAPSPGKPAGEI
jgi:hypothetical protein